jgi:DNA-directed RNA polymerase subunit beta'
LHDVYDPVSDQLLVAGGEEITADIAKRIEESGIESVEIRSVLTCESKRGCCVKCYGKNWQVEI